MRLSLIGLILSIITGGMPCLAGNALRGKLYSPKCKLQVRKAFEVQKENPVKRQEASIITPELAQKILPTHLNEFSQSNEFRDHVIQRSATALLNSDIIRNSFLMKTASQVQESTKMDLSVKSEEGPAHEKQVEHKFKFDLQALNGRAQVRYSGFVNSRLEYQALTDSLQFSVEEQLSEDARIAISHVRDNIDTRQLLQYQLTW
jgi:hypothetical protein